jgi:hypothetical protein
MSRQTVEPKSRREESDGALDHADTAGTLNEEPQEQTTAGVPRYMSGSGDLDHESPNYSQRAEKQADYRSAVASRMNVMTGETDNIPLDDSPGVSEETPDSAVEGQGPEVDTADEEPQTTEDAAPEDAAADEEDQTKKEEEGKKEEEQPEDAGPDAGGGPQDETAAGPTARDGFKEEDDTQTLLSVLPRMSPIRTPFVPSPPAPAIERRAEIIKRTGSPPELHHAQVRQSVERVAQAARDAQRRMIWLIGNAAKDTRISIEEMALEIRKATAAAVAQINAAIGVAVEDIKTSAQKETEHIHANKVLVAEKLQESRDSTMVKIFNDLKSGSQEIEAANKVIRASFDAKLNQAPAKFQPIPTTGKGGRFDVPTPKESGDGKEKKASPPPGGEGDKAKAPQYTTLVPVREELKKFVGNEATTRSKKGSQHYVKQYMQERSEPVVDGLSDKEQGDLVKAVNKRSAQLNSEATRAQFATIVLGLTSPVSEHHKDDTGKTAPNDNEAVNQQLEEAQIAERDACEVLKTKSENAVEYCEKDLRDTLTTNIRKAGNKAYHAVFKQGQASEIVLNNTAAPMAEAYRDLVDRINALLPPNRFLNSKTLVPRLLVLRDSAAKLCAQHEALALQQKAATIESLQKVVKDQVHSIADGARNSIESVRDVVTRCRFDYSLFSSQMTGKLSKGAEEVRGQARKYAAKVAKGILEAKQGVQNEGAQKLDETAARYINGAIDAAEQGQYLELEAFVKSLETVSNDNVLIAPMVKANAEFQNRSSKLDNAMPGRSAGTSIGLSLLCPIAGAVYLFKTRPDADEVIKQLGDIVWPGAGAVEEVFNSKYGNLQERIKDKLSNPEEKNALDLLNKDERVRAKSRVDIANNSTGWFDYSRGAREAAAAGMTAKERATLKEEDIAPVRAKLLDKLNKDQSEIAIAFLDNNRERAVAAKTREGLDDAKKKGVWGWIFSAQEAQQRSDQARVDVIANMNTTMAAELERESSYVSDKKLKASTDKVYQEFASLTDPLRRKGEDFTVAQGKEKFIAYATAGHAAAVLRPGAPIFLGPLMLPGARVSVEEISMSKEARKYIELAVRKGVDDDETRAARASYEVIRAERDDKSDLSETTQTRLTDAIEDQKLAELERQAKEGTPLERSRAKRQLVEERAAHQKRMQQIAINLGAPKEVQDSPELAEKWVADRVGGLFALTDVSSTAVSHKQYGREMVLQGRASLAAGVALATDKTGTHDDLLRRMYTNRSKTEIDDANKEWAATHKGQDMEVMLGIKKREADAWDYAAMAATPFLGPGLLAANYFLRGPETSGDLAMDLERLAKGNRKSDLDNATYAGLHYNQERVRGTGFIAEHSMQGTDEQRNLDGDRAELARIILAEAAKKDPAAAAQYALYPGAIFGADGSINPTIQRLAFDDKGKFLGDRSLLQHYSQNVSLSADAYRAEIDRQEAIITTAITVLAIVVSIALMFVPGVNVVVAGLIVAALAGAATIITKAGMRGERYGWEEMATDLAMTGIEMATAGIGGKLAGGLGRAGMLARVGEAMTARLGRVGAAVAREAFVGALNSGAQVALQDETWADGLGRGLERVASGALRGAAVGAVTAGVSESVSGKLGKSMAPGNLDPTEFSRMQKLGRALGPHGSEIFREAVSNMLGGLASETVGIMTDYANGNFHGNFGEALKQIGATGLRELATGAMRGAATSMNRARYRSLLDAARRSGGELTSSDMRVLRLAAISAGALHYGEGMGNLHAEIQAGRQILSMLPPAMREHAATLDIQALHKMIGMLDSGDLGTKADRSRFLHDLHEMVPGLDGRALMQHMEDVINNRPRLAETEVVPDTAEKTRLREHLASGLDDNLKSSLDRVRIDGLEHLPEADLHLAAEMVARGAFDSPTADALLRRAKQANPDLNEYTFLRHLYGAVETSRQAQQLDRMAREDRRGEVLSMIPEEGHDLFVGLPDESIKQVKDMLDRAKIGSPGEQEELFRAALAKDPALTREGFQRVLEGAVDNAITRQAEVRETERARREKQLLNVPEELRSVLSVLPEDALMELRLRQLEGGALTPAERSRLLDAAQLETPGVDVTRLASAIDEAVAARPQEIPGEQQARLRKELESGVPAEQRALLADATILVMRDSEFEAFTRSKTGQAVTLIMDGRPVVVMRESANPAVLREEGIHVLQRKDPEWAARLGALDERKLAQWDKLPLAEQLALYRNKVEIEVDAQRRLAVSLEGDLARATDPAEIARLKTQLEMAHSTLRNLENRAREAGGIGDLQMRGIEAGVLTRPQFLDQPARLFSKAEEVRKAPLDEQRVDELAKKLETDIGALAKMPRQELTAELNRLRSDPAMEPIRDLLDGIPAKVSDSDLRRVLGALITLRSAGFDAADITALRRSLAAMPGGPPSDLDRFVDMFRSFEGRTDRKFTDLAKRTLGLRAIQSDIRSIDAGKGSETLRSRLLEMALGGRNAIDLARNLGQMEATVKLLEAADTLQRMLPEGEAHRVLDRLLDTNRGVPRNDFNVVLDGLKSLLNTHGGNLNPVALRYVTDMFVANPKNFRESASAVVEVINALKDHPDLITDALKAASMRSRPRDVTRKLAALSDAIRNRADAETLFDSLRKYLHAAVGEPPNLQLIESLRAMGDRTIKEENKLTPDVLEALNGTTPLSGVRPTPELPGTLRNLEADFRRIIEQGGKVSDEQWNELTRQWHQFLSGNYRPVGYTRDFPVAESYSLLRVFLLHESGLKLTEAEVHESLRRALQQVMQDQRSLSLDAVRHAFKDQHRDDILRWVITGRHNGDLDSFDPRNLQAVADSLGRLEQLTTHGLNVKDRANVTEAWHALYREKETSRPLERQPVLEEGKNPSMASGDVPSTPSRTRQPDFADPNQTPKIIGDVKSHRGSLSGEDETRLRAYLQAVTQQPDGATVTMKRMTGTGEVETIHENGFVRVQVVFTNIEGAKVSAEMLQGLIDDFPVHFSFVVFDPRTGERFEVNARILAEQGVESVEELFNKPWPRSSREL